MQIAKIVDNEIVEVETLSRSPRYSGTRWWDLRDESTLNEWMTTFGYKEVVQHPRPGDTNESTYEPRLSIKDGVPVQEWVERAYTAQEISLREELEKIERQNEATVAIAGAYMHLNQTAHADGSEWVQPLGVHDAYAKGAKVIHGGKTWESLTFANVWEPGVSGWREIATGGNVAEWVQPTGAHDAYGVGDRVLHNGKTWESTSAANVWEPGVYGWIEV